VTLMETMFEQMRVIKVLIVWEKTRNPFGEIVCCLNRLSDVRFNGNREILRSSTSRPRSEVVGRSLKYGVRLIEVMLGNL